MSSKGLSLTLLVVTILAGIPVRAHEPERNSVSAAEAVQKAASDVPPRVRVTSAEMGKLIVKKVPPEYPKKARNKRIQGTVMLDIVIDKEGDVEDVSLKSGDPILAKAAIAAAKQWKYQPYLVQGEPVEVETTLQMNFTLVR